MAVDGIDERLDRLARGIERRASPGAVVRVQHALDELHGVLAIEPVQFAPVAVRVERRGQRLTAGEDDARVAHLQQALADGEDGLQLPACLLGERLGRLDVGRQEDALHVVHHEQRGLLGEDLLDRVNGLFQIVERGDGVTRHELPTDGIEHGGDVAVGLDRDKGRATSLVRADHPAGELGGERGLALAALAAHHGVALVAQQPLERQQLAAAANEGRRRLRGQRTETVSERGPHVRLRLRRRRGPEELRVVLFLEEHGHEPIVELQLPRAEDAAPGFVVIELALAFEHGIAHARTAGERGVEGLDEAARRLDKDAVAHGHHGGHADLQQLGGDGFGRLLGRRRLAGFEEDERDAVLAEQRAEFVGEHGDVAAVVELAGVLRILEAKAAEPGTAVKDAVAIEVDDVIGLGLRGSRGRAPRATPAAWADSAHGCSPGRRVPPSLRQGAAHWHDDRCNRRLRPPGAR